MSIHDRLPLMPFGVAAISIVLIVAMAAVAHSAVSREGGSRGPAAIPVDFMSENARAMDKMMADMAIAPSGNVDRDFVAMMVPHHQGAIDMALAQLRYGKDETLRRMAQAIIVEQQQEIAAMRLAAERLPASDTRSPVPSQICTSRPAQPVRLASPFTTGDL